MPRPHAPARAAGVLAAAALLLAAAPAAAAPSAQTRTLRLINRVRADHQLPRLHADIRLAQAARGHSRDMVANAYFSHRSPAGTSPTDRIAGTGWMRSRASWTVGEDLAWHAGPLSPKGIVRAWLHSPPHRRVLLDPRFHRVGIGIANGTPSGVTGSTFTADFGT